MNATFRNPVTENRMSLADDCMRTAFAQSFKALLDKEPNLTSSGPHAFDFKEIKGLMPSEVVVCTLTCTEGATGKMHFMLSKESAGVLADMLLMGDGNATFSHEDHLDPIRDFFKDVATNFVLQIDKKVAHLAFEDIKIVLLDLTPGDFSGGTWTVSKYDFNLGQAHSISTVISNEIYDAAFPRTETKISENGASPKHDGDFDDVMRSEIGLVMDIELPISIELGRTQMLIRDIVKLSPGSIVELNKLSGEPVDLYVNAKKFAKGEVVVVDENFAVRITELISPEERFSLSRN